MHDFYELERERFGLVDICGNVNMIGFEKHGLSVAAEREPAALVLEETPHTVHAAALHRAFNHESVTLEEVAVTVVL